MLGDKETATLELVPTFMIIGSVSEAVGATLLFFNGPPDVADGTIGEALDRSKFRRRRGWSRAGFFLLLAGSLFQLAAGLIWYRQPGTWG